LCLDLTVTQLNRAEASGFYASLRLQGITIIAAVYDLLPISMPSVFPPGTHIFHEQWIRAIANFDRAVCISEHVANQLHMWLKDYMPDARLCEQGRIASWMLGSDIEAAQPTLGLLPDMTQLNATLASERCFLMVGTIEPRKGYQEVLLAFENLWQRGYSLPLIIVGRKGWQHLPDEEREHIVAVCQLIERLAQQYRVVELCLQRGVTHPVRLTRRRLWAPYRRGLKTSEMRNSERYTGVS
jgi:glycosyltransferase involved in cell wall biosynthesis